jgi:hypothetical protein
MSMRKGKRHEPPRHPFELSYKDHLADQDQDRGLIAMVHLLARLLPLLLQGSLSLEICKLHGELEVLLLLLPSDLNLSLRKRKRKRKNRVQPKAPA